tara:strand:- start:24 stop:272 length:249 start_codon:yes stop_codon:yes gene_type:complete
MPNLPYANKHIGIPILPVLGRKNVGNSLKKSFFIKIKKINPTIKNEDNRINAYKKYSENIAKVTPLADIENITIDGVPKLAE